MPQLLMIVVGGACLWFGYKWVRKEQERVRAKLSEAEMDLQKQEEQSRRWLKKDPETGVYESSVVD